MPADDLEFSRTQALVVAAQGGDKPALEQLCAHYLPRVRAMSAELLGPELGGYVEIEDVVQISMMDAIRGIDDYSRQSEGRFVSWVARIVENNIRDLARRMRAKKRGEGKVARLGDLQTGSRTAPEFPANAATPSQEARVAELARALDLALAEMNERYRRVILLRMNGCSHEEIAKELGYGRAETARVKLSVARAQLKELLARFLAS